MAVVALLSLISLVSIYFLSRNDSLIYFKKQLFFVIAGFILAIVAGYFDYRIFKNYSSFLFAFYIVSVLLLIAVLFLGYKTRGTTGWFSIGGFNFAPVEAAKLAIILLLAKYFSLRHIELFRIRHLIASFIYVAVPLFFVIMQPDLGSASVLAAIWLGIIIISGIKFRHLLAIMLIGFILFGIMWIAFLKDYQKERILTFLNPEKDPLGNSYNLRQSMIAIGAGGLWGKGIGKGTQAQLDFLPEGHTDFIFAVIAEETGLTGVVILFLLFAILIYRILKIGMQAENNFARLFSVGFSLMLVYQIIINIGMNMGIVPIIGLPLPFVSYGGSSTIMNFIGLGILQSIRIRG